MMKKLRKKAENSSPYVAHRSRALLAVLMLMLNSGSTRAVMATATTASLKAAARRAPAPASGARGHDPGLACLERRVRPVRRFLPVRCSTSSRHGKARGHRQITICHPLGAVPTAQYFIAGPGA